MWSRVLLFVLVAIVTSQTCRADDYPLVYFCYARITTADTVQTGYFLVPYENPNRGLFLQFKQNPRLFQAVVLDHMKVQWKRDDIEVFDFVYIHQFVNKGEPDRAIYRSAGKQSIKMADIRAMELLHTVPCYAMEPHVVESVILPSDTTWTRQQVVATIDDPAPDPCRPKRYLVYDRNVNYKKLIEAVMREKDPQKQRELRENLRHSKIVALWMSTCI